MREIKFRGKISDSRWIYGSSLRIGEQFVSIGYGSFLWKNVTPDTVGQFTGLYDVDGKEIYEGDVIKIIPHGDVLQVVYNTSDAQFIGLNDRGKLSFANKYITYRVIGNIHDNPELLSETK